VLLKRFVLAFIVGVSSMAFANVPDMECTVMPPSGSDVHAPNFNRFTVPSVYPAPCDKISCDLFSYNYGIQLPLQDSNAADRILTVTAEYYGPSGNPNHAYFEISDTTIWNANKFSSKRLILKQVNLRKTGGLVDVQFSATTNDGYTVSAVCKSLP
jgi:hypothetical protein